MSGIPLLHQQPLNLRRQSRLLRRLVGWGLLDAVITLVAYLVTFSIRTLSFANFLDIEALPYILVAVVVTLVWLFVFRAYHYAWSQTSGESAINLMLAAGLAMLTNLLLNLMIQPRPIPLSVIVVASALTLSGTVVVRYRTRVLSGFYWRWRAVVFKEFPRDKSERVLIIGAGESGQALVRRLRQHTNKARYKLVGYVDDAPAKLGVYFEDLAVLGSRHQIPALVQQHEIDLIIVAIHNIDGPDFRAILALCEQTAARIKVVPDTLALLDTNHQAPTLRDVQPEDLIGRRLTQRHADVDLSPVQGKCILVTGAAGSIGSELSRQLTTYAPAKLILLDNNESALHDLCIDIQAQYPDLTLLPMLVDVTHRQALHRVFAQHQPQVVFHAAAYKHVPMLEDFPEEALRVNVGGTLNVTQMAHEHNAERFVLISTDKAVNPSSVMGASKRVCEHIVNAYSRLSHDKTRFTAVRFGNVLGSRGSVVPTFEHQIKHGGPLTITHAEMSRYFMSIAEAANLVIHAACLTQGDEIFLLRMGEKVRIVDIAERMIRMHGLRPYIDIPINFVGVRPGEKLHEELHTDAERPTETRHPHILQLDSGCPRGDAHLILHRISTLLKHGFTRDDDALQTLLTVTEADYNAASRTA